MAKNINAVVTTMSGITFVHIYAIISLYNPILFNTGLCVSNDLFL